MSLSEGFRFTSDRSPRGARASRPKSSQLSAAHQRTAVDDCIKLFIALQSISTLYRFWWQLPPAEHHREMCNFTQSYRKGVFNMPILLGRGRRCNLATFNGFSAMVEVRANSVSCRDDPKPNLPNDWCQSSPKGSVPAHSHWERKPSCFAFVDPNPIGYVEK